MLRRWFSLRSMLWHLLMVVIVSGCSYAAWWQWHRAAGGNTLSYLYSVEWPVFAIVAIIGWWQLVTEPPEELEARRQERRLAALPKPVAYDSEVLRRELAAHPELVRTFPELVKAFPELAAAAGELPPGEPALPPGPRPLAVDVDQSADAGVPVAGSSPVVPGPGSTPAVPDDAANVAPAPSQEVRAYNQVLGSLAAHGKPKTWRNPRGR